MTPVRSTSKFDLQEFSFSDAQGLGDKEHGAFGISNHSTAQRHFRAAPRGCRGACGAVGRLGVSLSEERGRGHMADIARFYGEISEKSGTRFWFHGLRNAFLTVAERELMLSCSLTKRLVNYARPQDVTEGYAADWSVGQLREPAQRIANHIDN